MASRQLYVVTCATVANTDLYVDTRPEYAVDRAEEDVLARWRERYNADPTSSSQQDSQVRFKLTEASRLFRTFATSPSIRNEWDIDNGHPASMGIRYAIHRMTVADINRLEEHPGTTVHWPIGHTIITTATDTASLADRLLGPR